MTMKYFFLLAFFLIPVRATSAGPSDIVVYKASDLQSFGKRLEPKVNEQKVAVQNLDNFGNHNTMVAHREGDGQVEIHEHYADVFVVVSGHATLLAGGTDKNAKATEPGELRGGAIVGGERHPLGPGDIVHIPAGVPHQVLTDSGHSFTYFVLKVETK
jgi:mannose-6-phosphate isomerase-like protein (cupin superfamily)